MGCGDSNLQDGWTALSIAAQNGRADCVRLLIDAGADKDAKTKVHVGRYFSGCHPILPSLVYSYFLFYIIRVFKNHLSYCVHNASTSSSGS